ncbi:TlpA family protein disulfide reductase [Nocardioides sp. Root190]|uniref:TlpA family protein disulfide reductase n=1 Tax=Nocardioides sp. Root190 TaxID=1736488 RepID=UPI0009EA910F|nr:TlpA disulfide reductase family protein [Nocardioides sp. Root190]
MTFSVSGRGINAVGTILVAVGALSACGVNTGGSPTATRGVVDEVAVDDRISVEPFTGTLLDGKRFDSRDLAGKVVVYNVWGSWCAPCRSEAANLEQVSQETKELGVQFVGVNVRDNDAAARAFEDRYGIAYSSISTDTSGKALLAFGPALPPSAVPSTMIVDAEGRLAVRIIGPVDATTLGTLISDTLAEATDGTAEPAR